MDISSYSFSDEEIFLIRSYRDKQEDGRLKIRFIALILLAKGTHIRDIADIIGKSPITIERWFESYVSKGIDSLNSFGYKPKKTFLTDEQIEQLIKWIKKTYPPNLKAIRTYIQDMYNVSYSIPGIQKLLKKKGLSVSEQK